VRDGLTDHGWRRNSGCNVRDVRKMKSTRGTSDGRWKGQNPAISSFTSPCANPVVRKGICGGFILCGLSPPVSPSREDGQPVYLRANGEFFKLSSPAESNLAEEGKRKHASHLAHLPVKAVAFSKSKRGP
jgi:hypothetical protein